MSLHLPGWSSFRRSEDQLFRTVNDFRMSNKDVEIGEQRKGVDALSRTDNCLCNPVKGVLFSPIIRRIMATIYQRVPRKQYISLLPKENIPGWYWKKKNAKYGRRDLGRHFS